jgi:hypothetical protein
MRLAIASPISYKSWSAAVGLMFIILSLLVLSPGMAKIIPKLPGFSTTIIYAPPSAKFLRGWETCTLKLFTFLIYKYAQGGRDFFKEAR